MPETAVHYDVRDGVAVLTIDYPPVNALGAPVRDGLAHGLRAAVVDPGICAIIICGAGGRFIAGADIAAIGKPKTGAPYLDILDLMESSPKPVVVAIDGYALGGGLELALTARFRVAGPGARLGLPEINLGLLPGGGGTQRLTRLIGPKAAMEIILSGAPVNAARALELGLVDAVLDGDLLSAAIAFAADRALRGDMPVNVIDRSDRTSEIDPAIFEDMRQRNARKWTGMVAPYKIVDCVEAACRLEPAAGLAFETAAFAECMAAPARLAMTHLFFAERSAAKVVGLDPAAKAIPVRRLGVIGAGTMGGGIAMSALNAGLAVVLLDATPQALEAGIARVRNTYDISVGRGSRSAADVATALARLEATTDYAALADCDLIIEAVFEKMALKKEIFARLDPIAKPGAILATNTSGLDIDEIASATGRPEAVIGMHFFSPANVMRLCENVRGSRSSDVTIATAMSFARQIGKVPVLAGNCPGFIGNRIMRTYRAEADRMLEEGATPWQVDGALKAFGFPMGLYLMMDLAGLDVAYQARRGLIESGLLDTGAPDYPPLADRLVEAGRLGQKSAAGYYRYEGREGTPDNAVEDILLDISAAKGLRRRAFSSEEILDRILTSIVCEAAWILDEGYAQRASDIDVVYVLGYGFPAYRGGPMFWAEQQGLARIAERIERYRGELGARWRVAPLLARLAVGQLNWKGETRAE